MKPPRKPQGRSVKKAPDDKVWQNVARTVTPLGKGTSRPAKSDTRDFANMIRLPPSLPEESLTPETPLEMNGDKRTRRGRIHIDMRVDLHDKTQAEALPLLLKTLDRAASRKARCVLVITGKGLRLDGVLRRNFPLWINHPDIRPLIASYAQSHIRHGGTGAWYVFMKSEKNKNL